MTDQRKIKVFNQVSLDGCFTDANGDMSWAYRQDPEWMEFVSGNASGDSELLFGRKTYDQMRSFWPTPAAEELSPAAAKKMNAASKLVYSRTLKETEHWSHTRLVKGDLAIATKALKAERGPDLVLMGSGTIVAQLTEADLIDEFQLVVVPVVLGRGRSLFEGVKRRPELRLTDTRRFSNGNVVLWYART